MFSSFFHADLPIFNDIFKHRRSLCRRSEQFQKKDEPTSEKISMKEKKSLLIPTEQQFLFEVKKKLSFLKKVLEKKLGKEEAK